jgi:hypothetical protein
VSINSEEGHRLEGGGQGRRRDPTFVGHLKVALSTPQVHLLQAAILLLLVSNVLPYHCFVSTDGRDEVPLRPEMLSHKIALLLPVYTGQMDRTLAFDKSDTCETAYFDGNEIIM